MAHLGKYVATKYYINACRVNYLIKNKLDNSQTISQFRSSYKMDSNTSSRFDTLYDDSNYGLLRGLDTTKIKHPDLGIIKVDDGVINFIEEQIDKATGEFGQYFLLKDKIYKNIQDNIIKYLKERGDFSVSKINVAIDNGNTDVKVVAGIVGSEETKEFIFASKAKQESYLDVEKNTNDYIYIDEAELFFVGRKFDNAPATTRKAQKNNRPIFIYSICRAVQELGLNVDKVDVNIMLLNPIDELQDFEVLKQELEKCNDTICECRVGGQTLSTQINITNVRTIAEGVASWMTIEDTTGSDLLIDLGSKTLNWVLSNDDTIEIADTIQWGTDKYFEKLGIKYGLNLDEIKRVAGKKKFEHDSELFGVYLNEVISKVEADCKVKGFIGIDNIWFSGGGTTLAEIVGVDIESADESYKVIPEARMSNVRGAYEVMKGE